MAATALAVEDVAAATALGVDVDDARDAWLLLHAAANNTNPTQARNLTGA